MTRTNTLTKLFCAVLVLCGLLCCAGAAGADECTHSFADGVCTVCGLTGGYCGAEGDGSNVMWTLADNHLVISGTGAMADFYYTDRAPWYNEGETITDVTIGNGVTRIGDYAFCNFCALTEITIPASVETIGDGVFESCVALETVTFAEGSRLSSLGHLPYFDCTSLTAISIPESVTAYKTIDGVLYSGDGTTLLLYPASKVGESFTTPAGVTIIAECAFFDTQLHTVTLSEGVIRIDNRAFYSCSRMQSVSLPSTLTFIDACTFEHCSSLTTVTIPASVTCIGSGAFRYCSNLTTVTIPASVTSIGDSAFANCDALTTVNAPCSWDGSLYTFEDTVTVNKVVHTGGTATCTKGAVCELCGETYGETDPGNHAFADGACTDCGLTGGYCGASTNEGGEQSVTWTLADNHLVISGTGAMADFYYTDRTPWYNECETITDVTIGNGVTRIGDYAFHYFQSLTEITIPASVESIGYQAFGSSTVSSVTFAPNSRLTTIDGYAFNYLVSLKQITLPASVESIGDGAFESCNALETVTIEEGSRLSSLGNMPFSDCYSLTSISIPESATACKTIDGVLYSGDGTTLLLYPAGRLYEAFTTPAGVTTIAESALSYAQFRTVILSEGVTTIGNGAFNGCSRMKSVSLPSTLTSIGDSAFAFCSNLTTVTIPASVTSIGNSAFYNCGNLTTVTIPASVTSIGSKAFERCNYLTTVNVPCNWDGSLYTFEDTVTVVVADHTFVDGACTACGVTGGYCGASTNAGGEQSVVWTYRDGTLTITGEGAMADYESGLDSPWNSYARSVTALHIGEGVTRIGSWALFDFPSVSELTIPASVTSIGESALDGIGATSITFAADSRLTTIEPYAFFYADSLKQITLPASVETLGNEVFGSCKALESVTFAEGSRLSSIGDDPFIACYSLTAISIPESVTAYRTVDGVLYSGDGTTLLYYPQGKTDESFTTPAGVTTIAESAFVLAQVSSVTLSEGVTTIEAHAFDMCAFTSVSLPDTLTTIGKYAFAACPLTEVTIPASVKSIGEDAFYLCDALTTAVVPCNWDGSLYTFGEGVALVYAPHVYDEGGVCTVCDYEAKASIGRGADVLYFDTLPDALAAVEPEDKINMLADCDEDITIPSSCEWYGSDFTCSGTVVNHSIIYDGVFTGHVTNSDSIVGGTFDGEVTNQHIICGGTFNNAVTNDGHLSSGEFNGVLTNNATIHNVAGVSWFTLGADFVLINNGTLTCESHIDPTVANCEHAATCRLCGEYGEPDPANHTYQSNICCGVCGAEGDGTNVKWTLVDGVLTITGTGAMADYDSYDDSPLYTYCNSITALTIQEGVTTIGRYAFFQTAGLKSVTIPASVTKLGYCAFADSGLETVTFADESQLTTIDSFAFQLCDELTEITLPAGVGSFRPDVVFDDCTALTDIHVAEGNTTYKDIDGVLYTADGTTLVFYPEGKTAASFTTPAGVTTIGQTAFDSNGNIKSVTLSEGVTTISDQAFLFCDALTEITIPASVESIGMHAFYGCTALTTVNAPCNWDGSLYTFADTVTVNVPEHTGGKANCQSAAICGNCGTAYGELDYDVHANTEVVWEWYPNNDSVTAYATLTCSDCGEELEVASGDGEFLGEVEPTDCQHLGSMSYSATLTFEDGTKVTGTHTVAIPSENHVGPMNNGFCAACGGLEKPAVDPGEYEDETWDDVYLISNAGQLYWFANEVNSGNNGIGGRLTANITVPASVSKGGSIPDWEPIGQGWTPYCGDFNGGGHTISGLYCESSRAGLFGYTDYNYTIRNVGVSNGTFIGSEYAGALVGYASSTISGCWASGNTIEGNYAGGLVGQNIGTVTASRATGNTVKGSLAGGLVGYNNNGTIGRSYGTGNTVTGDSAGGLVGENYGTVENSYSTGNTAGYLVGYNGGPITNCFTDGSALFRDSYGDVTNSYYVASAATEDGGRKSKQFASGEIAWLLQSGVSSEEVWDEETGEWVMADAPLIWGQSIGSASYPTLGGQRVYQVLSCDGESNAYSNTDEPQEHSFTDSVCANCDIIGGYYGAEGDGTHIVWTLEDGTLTITGTGAMADHISTDVPWNTYSNSITAVSISEGVTHIGEFAFRSCRMTEIVIPASVESLGKHSFLYCHYLESVSFAEGSRLTTIGDYAFWDCTALEEITVPAGVTLIESAFPTDGMLKNIFVAEGNTAYKDIDGVLYTADGTVLLTYPVGRAEVTFTTPEGVKTIAQNAFENSDLQKVILSDGVTLIEPLAFWSNSQLHEITIPASMTYIDFGAFEECYSLTTVNAPCNWDGSLFTFEDSVTVSIASHSYEDGVCVNCSSACPHDSWTDGVCGDCGFACPHDTGNGGTCSICGATVARTMVILPASLTAIDAEAFTGTAAEAVVIPAGCTSIGSGAFSGCGSLEAVIFTSANCSIAEGAIPTGAAIIAPAGGTVEAWAEANGVAFVAAP